MAIDDPIDAAEAQIASDERLLPSKWIEGLLICLGELGGPLAQATNLIQGAINKRRDENLRYLVEVLVDEVRKLTTKLRVLSDDHAEFIRQEFPGLCIEGARRAQECRSRNRIRRIAQIIAHAVEVGPKTPADTADEMMRIAAELGDEDVSVLRDIYEAQASYGGTPDINVSNSTWKKLQSQKPSFLKPDVFSVCAKLQSFGLVVAVERIPTAHDLQTVPYAILPRGIQFVEFVREASEEGLT